MLYDFYLNNNKNFALNWYFNNILINYSFSYVFVALNIFMNITVLYST